MQCPAFAQSEQPEKVNFSAEEVLSRMAKVYGNAKSYQDSGKVITSFFTTYGVWRTFSTELTFSTAFMRPDQFRFEFEEGGGEYIIWRKGRDVQSWWYIFGKVEKEESLNRALFAGTGVSSGSAHTIPILLMPNEVAGRKLTDITEPKLVQNTEENMDCICYQVEGKYAGDSIVLWIQEDNFLIRRIKIKRKYPSSSSEEITTYNARVNTEIPPGSLIFNHP